MKFIIPLLLIVQFTFSQITPATNKISVDVSTAPQNSAYNYDSCFTVGSGLGMTQTGMFQTWSAIETSSVSYNFLQLNIANIYYPAKSMALDLTIAPIATNVLEVPADLATTSFSSSVMINRFKRLLDSIKVHIPNVTLSSLVIGSEHDIYLGSNTINWANYTVFYNAVSAYAKTLWPGLKVATELTFDGITTQNSLAQTLNANSDYIGVSYYLINSGFTVKPLSSIPADFATLTGLYPSKQLCFYQYGCPSSTLCNSSNAYQTQFITQTFLSWDNYPTKIRMIDFTWLHDLSVAQVNYYSTYYGITNPVFLEYLRTIGLRTWAGNGADKPALNELRCQAKARGYNTLTLTCTTGINDGVDKENAVSVYPNPFNTKITVSENNKNQPVSVYNALGSLIFTSTMGTENLEIDLSHQASGIYFIRVGSVTKKLIKE